MILVLFFKCTMYICFLVLVHAWVHACMRACKRAYVRAWLCVCVHACVFVFMRACGPEVFSAIFQIYYVHMCACARVSVIAFVRESVSA